MEPGARGRERREGPFVGRRGSPAPDLLFGPQSTVQREGREWRGGESVGARNHESRHGMPSASAQTDAYEEDLRDTNMTEEEIQTELAVYKKEAYKQWALNLTSKTRSVCLFACVLSTGCGSQPPPTFTSSLWGQCHNKRLS